MGCDYYIQTELIIEYNDKAGRINTIYTNRKLERCYVFHYQNKDSDDDLDTMDKKHRAEIERRIKNNTYNKILYQNGEWVKESYKRKYEDYLFKTYKDIVKFIKIYKKYSAWERE